LNNFASFFIVNKQKILIAYFSIKLIVSNASRDDDRQRYWRSLRLIPYLWKIYTNFFLRIQRFIFYV